MASLLNLQVQTIRYIMPTRIITKTFDAIFDALGKLTPLLRILLIVLLAGVFIEGYVVRILYIQVSTLQTNQNKLLTSVDSVRIKERAIWEPKTIRLQATIDSTNKKRILDLSAEVAESKKIQNLVTTKLKRSDEADRVIRSKSVRNENLTNKIENVLNP